MGFFFFKLSALLNKFTKTSPYRQTTFLLLKFQVLRLLYFYQYFYHFLLKLMIFEAKSSPYGPIRALMGPQGPYGPIWAPTRTGPQPGLGPNPGPGRMLRKGVKSEKPENKNVVLR